MKRDFTSTVYLIENQRVLLLFHRKVQKWLPPGGHIEANETPSEAARREVLEETGIEFYFCLQENIVVKEANAVSIERPYLCLLEEIPSHGGEQAHQHVDFIYVGKPIRTVSEPSFVLRWFSWGELLELEPEREIFQETLNVIEHLFQNSRSLQSGNAGSLPKDAVAKLES